MKRLVALLLVALLSIASFGALAEASDFELTLSKDPSEYKGTAEQISGKQQRPDAKREKSRKPPNEAIFRAVSCGLRGNQARKGIVIPYQPLAGKAKDLPA